ncbi:hypothetical protein ADK43_26815 [Streptomyces rimosus subsp. rimosus]|nr:hypothetical protein ADK43_26815 [Streptomyces rimosus subsp. rimosus]
MESVECRRVFDTTVSGTPALIEIVADRCRRSWIVVRETPAFRQGRWNRLRTYSGWRGRPSGLWNTKTPSSPAIVDGRLSGARWWRVVATRPERATQFLLLLVLGVVITRRLLSIAESVACM